MTPSPRKANEAAEISKLKRLIHVAKRDLQLDDETYRAALGEVTEKYSTTEMTLPELEKVMVHFKGVGFQVRHAPGKNPSRPLASDPQDKKIRALWLDLHEMDVVRNPSEAALAAYVKREIGVDALQWLTIQQKSRVIERLKQWQSRETKKRQGSAP